MVCTGTHEIQAPLVDKGLLSMFHGHSWIEEEERFFVNITLIEAGSTENNTSIMRRHYNGKRFFLVFFFFFTIPVCCEANDSLDTDFR